jgi:hypothetical protein
MTIINFFARSNLFLLHDLMRFQRRFTVAMNVKTNCLRKYVDNVFYDLSRNVKCDLKNAIQICSLQKLFKMIHSRDYAWSSHRQFFWFVKSHLWLMTHAHSWLSSDVYLFSICQTTFMMKRQVWRSISSNLTRTIHQTWRSISLNLTRTTHQTWRKRRHLIKLDESVISWNLRSSSHQIFWKKRQFFYFLMSDTISCNNAWYRELSFAENHFYFARR